MPKTLYGKLFMFFDSLGLEENYFFGFGRKLLLFIVFKDDTRKKTYDFISYVNTKISSHIEYVKLLHIQSVHIW